MTTTKTILSVLSLWMMATTVLLCVVSIDAFTVQRSRSCTMSQQNDEQNTINMKQTKPLVVLSLSNDNNNGNNNDSFWKRFDDAVDDFFNKRMGNGEIFYGKRKVNPSGRVEGNYNGFGMTDKLKIDQTREFKEIWKMERMKRTNEGEKEDTATTE